MGLEENRVERDSKTLWMEELESYNVTKSEC